jgi:hypothetical protein
VVVSTTALSRVRSVLRVHEAWPEACCTVESARKQTALKVGRGA